MSRDRKWSSNDKNQLLVENFRKFMEEGDFVNEEEAPAEEDSSLEKKAIKMAELIAKNESDVETGQSTSDTVNGLFRGNAAQGPYEMLLRTNISKKFYEGHLKAKEKYGGKYQSEAQIAAGAGFEIFTGAIKGLSSAGNKALRYATVGWDKSGHLSALIGGDNYKNPDAVAKLLKIKDGYGNYLKTNGKGAEIDFYKIWYRMHGLPGNLTIDSIGRRDLPLWISGVNNAEGRGASGYNLILDNNGRINQELVAVAKLKDTLGDK